MVIPGTQEKQTLESAQNANQHCGTRKRNLTQERLKELLSYNPETGVFTWRVYRSYNADVGDIAGRSLCGYISIGVDGTNYYAQRLAWLYMEGYFPEHDVDHKNRIKKDNRWCNLRHVSHRCNSRNCKIRKNNRSGITGVCWHRLSGKWHSRIRANGKRYNLGLYTDFDDAVCARLAAEQCIDWSNCDSLSPAFKYVQENIIKPKETK